MLLRQISDPHFVEEGSLAYGRIDTPGMLERCVRKILELPRQPDALIATGDLTEHATAAEYGFLGELLAPPDMPIFLAVGNHEERGAMQATFAHQSHLRGDGKFVQYVIDDFALRVVVLDMVVPNQEGGELCERRLR